MRKLITKGHFYTYFANAYLNGPAMAVQSNSCILIFFGLDGKCYHTITTLTCTLYIAIVFWRTRLYRFCHMHAQPNQQTCSMFRLKPSGVVYFSYSRSIPQSPQLFLNANTSKSDLPLFPLSCDIFFTALIALLIEIWNNRKSNNYQQITFSFWSKICDAVAVRQSKIWSISGK